MTSRISRPTFSATTLSFLVLFFGCALWAAFAELDYGVHAFGTVGNLNPPIQIQHNAVARVSDVHVKEGEFVKKEQLLVTLEDSDSLAETLNAETKRLSLRLQIDVLRAELAMTERLPYPDGISPIVPPDIVSQSFRAASESLRQRLSSHREQLEQFAVDQRSGQAQLAQVREQLTGTKAQLDIVIRQLEGLEPMLREGLVARSTVDDQRFRQEELRRTMAGLLGEQERLSGMLSQADSKRRMYLADREKDLKGKLTDLLPGLKGAEQVAQATQVRLRSHEVRAREDGQIINVKARAQGEVVSAGMVLMELIPVEKRYFVDARIIPSEIETAHPGMPAEIRFTTLPSKATSLVDGHLTSISTDISRDEKTGEQFYIARIEFDDDVSKTIGMEPVLGMPVQALLKGGRRTVLSYLIDPFKLLFMKAMKEQ